MSTYRLAFPERLPSGAWQVTVAIGTECATEAQAFTLLCDRIANGDAFPGEFVQSPVASELLAALRGLLLTENGLQTGRDHEAAVSRARAAVAKAEGK